MNEDLKIKLTAILAELDASGIDAAQMILTCRKILDVWVNAGGSSLDDDVIGFLGIESQTNHVLAGRCVRSGRDGDHARFEPGSAEEAAEIEDCGRVFLGGFAASVNDIRARVNSS